MTDIPMKNKNRTSGTVCRGYGFFANIIGTVLSLRNGIDEHIIDAANCLLKIGFLYGNDYV